MTFKDLKKRVSLEVAEQQTKLFERLQNMAGLPDRKLLTQDNAGRRTTYVKQR